MRQGLFVLGFIVLFSTLSIAQTFQKDSSSDVYTLTTAPGEYFLARFSRHKEKRWLPTMWFKRESQPENQPAFSLATELRVEYYGAGSAVDHAIVSYRGLSFLLQQYGHSLIAVDENTWYGWQYIPSMGMSLKEWLRRDIYVGRITKEYLDSNITFPINLKNVSFKKLFLDKKPPVIR